MNNKMLSRERITKEVEKAKKSTERQAETVRIVFSPTDINEANLQDVASVYSRVGENDFDTVVIVESTPGAGDKKIPMSSNKMFRTSLGEIQVNDKLRNDFCDEDDDFFIDDEAFEENLSLFDQLKILQCVLHDFTALSIQITDEGSFIVKELAHALEEILASKNALIVICCDLIAEDKPDYENIWEMIKNGNQSAMMNYLNSDKLKTDGIGSFVAGLIVANAWGLNLEFETESDSDYIVAYAEMQKHAIFS